MSKLTKLKKGYDIKILGKPLKNANLSFNPRTFAVKPTDFIGVSPIPKVVVNVGDEVKAGDQLFFDKKRPDVSYNAPVSGEIVEVNRGEKRAISEVVILADSKMEFRKFTVPSLSASREEIIKALLESGCWPSIIQRPFGVVADPNDTPRDIFISCYDSSPLDIDIFHTIEGDKSSFQSGVNALAALTSGAVHLGVENGNEGYFSQISNAQVHKFSGPHPAGNVGVQIHHTAAINKGEIIWTLRPQDVITIGRFFAEGKYDTSRMVAIGGPVIKNPAYVKTYAGASVEDLLTDNLSDENIRVISGDVLTGKNIGSAGHINSMDHKVTVIEEGDDYELFGWLLPSYARPSLSNTIPAIDFQDTFPFKFSSKFPFIKMAEGFNVNTNTHGEHRALVVTGQYEEVLPMDIYPYHLVKAILSNDYDLMEGLGIYEVLEEDLALCEFACTSKYEVQKTLRAGLDELREQG